MFTMKTSKRVDDALSSGRGRGVPVDPKPSKLRVFFVTEEDPLYVVRFFDVFFAEYPREESKSAASRSSRAFHEPMMEDAAPHASPLWSVGDFFVRGSRFIGARLRGRSIASLAGSARESTRADAIGQ